LTPGETDVRVALGAVRAPAVSFATAGVDLRERAAEQWLDLEELVEQITAPLLEPEDLLLQIRA